MGSLQTSILLQENNKTLLGWKRRGLNQNGTQHPDYLLLEGRHKSRLVESKGSLATSLEVHFRQLPEHKVAGQQQSFTGIGVALGHLQGQQRVVDQQGRALVQPLAPARSAHSCEQ